MPSKKDEGKRKGSEVKPAAESGGWLRKYWPPALAVLVVLLIAGVWINQADGDATVKPAASKAAPIFALGQDRFGGPSAPATPEERAAQIATVKQQLALAEHTLCSYQDGSKYPDESRPIAQHPDQIYPNLPVAEVHPMRTSSYKGDPSVQLSTTQSRVYVANGESVTFTVKALDTGGKQLPLFVTRAIASPITATGSRIGTQIVLPFADDGANGDAASGDGTFSGVLTPGATSFASFNGTIRTEVKYNVGDRSGSVLFDVIYTSEIPATWAGSIREAVEDGSLNLYLKADIRHAGRYLVSGRVDDAKGKPFALVSFNDLLPQGPTEIKLPVFGKLLNDQQPAFPLSLRDVDAYLLKENTDPDRALMPRLMGKVYATKTYAPKSFSDAEWQSEQRSRYLTEFSKDVNAAKTALAQLSPEQARQILAPTDCVKVAAAPH
ncbi:hypothetical protein BH11PSE11_BH11PSE11_27150 [soil metagenome]